MVMSLNFLFCPNYNPKLKEIQFTINEDKKKTANILIWVAGTN